MGLDGLSIWHLLIIFAIVVVIFGTGRLRTIGPDLGKAIRSFREALSGETTDAKKAESSKNAHPAAPDAQPENKDRTP
ncbi:Twin-arginine translocation protein TatA/E [mine drainage metagenome]|uniref:Twin-arginine translocation protein TatA/E n=1 Tax=mine drainage metagenome TaxID=410659 RepID=T0YF77_9ZZZZ